MSKSVKVKHIYVGTRAPVIGGNLPLLWVDTAAEPPVMMVNVGNVWTAVSPPEPPAVAQTASTAKKAPYIRKSKDESKS